MRGRVRAQGGRAGRPRMPRAASVSCYPRRGRTRRRRSGVGTRRARGDSAVDGHRRDAREGKRRGAAAAASAAAAARRDAFDARARRGGKGICQHGLYDFVPRRVSSGSGVSGVSGVFSDDETARAREGERILVAGRFDDLAGELGELRGGRAAGGARRRAGREESRDDSGSEPVACTSRMCTSRVYQSCVPVVYTSRVYRSFQWWRSRDERSMRVRRGRGGTARGAARRVAD